MVQTNKLRNRLLGVVLNYMYARDWRNYDGFAEDFVDHVIKLVGTKKRSLEQALNRAPASFFRLNNINRESFLSPQLVSKINKTIQRSESQPALNKGQRRLAAIMFTDIVGYTTRAQKNEPEALTTLERYYGLLRPLFAKHNGHEVKTIGDAFLVEFRSAVDAVKAALDVQRTLRKDGKILTRVGIHLGEVVEHEGDIYGDAVNVASRIEPLANPGGICISRPVYDNVVNKLNMRFEALGPRKLKNVTMPMELFAVTMPGDRFARGARRAPRLSVSARKLGNSS